MQELKGDWTMDFSTVVTMIVGMVFTWGVPIAIIVSIVVLFKRVRRIEKKIDK